MGSSKKFYCAHRMRITKNQQAALTGMILGDGYVQATGARNARLRLEHRADHRAYLVWKTKLLPQIFQGKPKMLERIHPHTRRTYYYARQQSNTSPDLGKMRLLFYPNGKKYIPESLSRWLKSDIAFAIWFYDDGYYDAKDRSVYLYLGTVTRREAEYAHDALRDTYNLQNTIVDKKKKGYALYFPVSEREKIKVMLEKYRVPVMAYKIPS